MSGEVSMVQPISASYRHLDSQSPGAIGGAPGPAELAQARLRASPYLCLRTLRCDSHEGVLAIRGHVSTYYMKQIAQTVVRDLPGVEEINNQVQVVRPGPRVRPLDGLVTIVKEDFRKSSS